MKRQLPSAAISLSILGMSLMFLFSAPGSKFLESFLPLPLQEKLCDVREIPATIPFNRRAVDDTKGVSSSPSSSSSRLGIEHCTARKFVEWQDEEAGIIRLVRWRRRNSGRGEKTNDDQAVNPKRRKTADSSTTRRCYAAIGNSNSSSTLGPPVMCPQMDFWCCGTSNSRKPLPEPLTYDEARSRAMKPYEEEIDKRRKRQLWADARGTTMEEEKSGQHPPSHHFYYQVAPHLAEYLQSSSTTSPITNSGNSSSSSSGNKGISGSASTTTTNTSDHHRHPLPSSNSMMTASSKEFILRSRRRCMCLVFSCAEALCNPGSPDNHCTWLGKKNILLRYPRTHTVRSLVSSSPPSLSHLSPPSTSAAETEAAQEEQAQEKEPKKPGDDNHKPVVTDDHESLRRESPDEKQRVKKTVKGGVDAPNILVFLVDSVSMNQFKTHFPKTEKFLEKMRNEKKLGGLLLETDDDRSMTKKEETPSLTTRGRSSRGISSSSSSGERVVVVEDNNALGSQSHWNYGPLLMGKLPQKCTRVREWLQGTPTEEEDGSYFQEFQNLKKEVVTSQIPREDILQSHILKVAKDHGYFLSAGLFPVPFGATENSCIGVHREVDMLRIPDKYHHLHRGTTSQPFTPVADIFQWTYWNEAYRKGNRAFVAVNGSQGCISQQHSIDFTEEFIDAIFSSDPPPVVATAAREGGRGTAKNDHWKTVEERQEEGEQEEEGPKIAVVAEQTAHQGDWERGSIDFFDARIAATLNQMLKKGILEDTVVVFVGDHGLGIGRTQGITHNSHGDLVKLMEELHNPVLWYLLPPSRSYSSASTSEREEYHAALRRKGRRVISNRSREMFQNIIRNGNDLKMRVTHFDTYATLINLISSSSTFPPEGEPMLQRPEGVAEFARSMTVDYEARITAELKENEEKKKKKKKQPTTETAEQQGEEGRKPDDRDNIADDDLGNNSTNLDKNLLQSALWPSCSEMGIFLHSCRFYADVDVRPFLQDAPLHLHIVRNDEDKNSSSTYLTSTRRTQRSTATEKATTLETVVKSALRDALSNEISLAVPEQSSARKLVKQGNLQTQEEKEAMNPTRQQQRKVPCRFCVDWSKLDLETSFEISTMDRRSFEDGSFFFTLLFDVKIPQGRNGLPHHQSKTNNETRGGGGGGGGGGIHRIISFRAETEAKRFLMSSSNSSSVKETMEEKNGVDPPAVLESDKKKKSLRDSTVHFLSSSTLTFQTMKRLSTYAEDEDHCGADVKNYVDSVRKAHGGGGEGFWEKMQYCACGISIR